MQIDLNNVENLKPITKPEIGEPTKPFLHKMSHNQVLGLKKDMQRFYKVVAQYLQRKLPLDNELIFDLICLHPLSQKEDRSVCAIGRIAKLMPQVVDREEVSLVR